MQLEESVRELRQMIARFTEGPPIQERGDGLPELEDTPEVRERSRTRGASHQGADLSARRSSRVNGYSREPQDRRGERGGSHGRGRAGRQSRDRSPTPSTQSGGSRSGDQSGRRGRARTWSPRGGSPASGGSSPTGGGSGRKGGHTRRDHSDGSGSDSEDEKKGILTGNMFTSTRELEDRLPINDEKQL